MSKSPFNPVELFSLYMQATGVPSLAEEPGNDPLLKGKKLGIINGSSWVSLWTSYFGKDILPGVKIINVGNEGVQLNFMEAHKNNRSCPPQINIDLFTRYAEDLVSLCSADVILISCSTMNRSAGTVRDAMKKYNVPVIQIDEAMMEEAVMRGGKILIIATHGPTVKSTQDLLKETASRLGREVSFSGATVEKAFNLLGEGDIEGHNEIIAQAIEDVLVREEIKTVVLAQLSMTVFKLSYPDCMKIFGVPVLTSGETGFQRVKEIFTTRQETS